MQNIVSENNIVKLSIINNKSCSHQKFNLEEMIFEIITKLWNILIQIYPMANLVVKLKFPLNIDTLYVQHIINKTWYHMGYVTQCWV